MPLSSNQLATLVERARHRAPPVVSPPTPSPPRSVRQRRDASAAPAAARPQLRSEVPTLTPEAPVARALPPQPEKPAPLPAEPATPDDSPWFLDKSSWRFHRRFYAVFRRPMQRGEYSCLLKQIRFGHAEHLGENCWRVSCRRTGNRRHRPCPARQPWEDCR
jgi:hypothetical protein